MSTVEKDTQTIKESYDNFNYESKPFPQTHPGHLQAIANLFGLAAPDFSQARILELGCASGGNIIPIASYFPKATIVGIDLSTSQIEIGQKMIDEVKLSNITLKAMDISDVTKEEFGLFDYIIVHGIYSWVPENVQNNILRVCNELLTNNGVSYVSYNTLPGWNIPKSFREMMVYHTRNIDDPNKKIDQALALAEWISKVNEDGLNSKILKEELKNAKECTRYYFLHEYLEHFNEPCYFHEFMERVGKHDLQYLSETHLVSTFIPALLPSTILNSFPKINDIIDEGQYLDFLINRKFRMTLLCKNSNKLVRETSFKNLAGVSVKHSLACSIPTADLTLDNISTAEIKSSTSIFNSKDKLFGHLVFQLIKQGLKLISITELLIKTCASLGSTDSETILKLQKHLLNLLYHGGVDIIQPEMALKEATAGKMPKINALAKYQIEHFGVATLINHSNMTLNSDIHKILTPLIDGTSDQRQILEQFIKIVEEKNLPVNKAGVVVTDVTERNELLKACVDEFILLLTANNLLEN